MVVEGSNQAETVNLRYRQNEYRNALLKVPQAPYSNSFACYAPQKNNNLSQPAERKPLTKVSNVKPHGKKYPGLSPSKSSSSFLYAPTPTKISDMNFEPPPVERTQTAPPNLNELGRKYPVPSQRPDNFPGPPYSHSQPAQNEFQTAPSLGSSSHTTKLKRPLIQFGTVEPELLMKLEYRNNFIKPSSASSISAESSAGRNGQERSDKLIGNFTVNEMVKFWASLAKKSETSEVNCKFCRNHLKQCCGHTILKFLSTFTRMKNGR